MTKVYKYKYFLFAGLLLSCAQMNEGRIDHIDPYAELNRDDYKNQLSPKQLPEPTTSELVTKVETKVPPLPKISDVLITPSKPKVGNNKTVSISVTEDVPLKDVFLELAKLANVDIEVDPTITGGVIFKATNKPFAEVVERICDLAGLRYSENGGVLRIEADKAYTESYQASFLNLIRKSAGDIGTSNKVLGSSSSGGGGESGGSTSSSSASGSQNSITSSAGGDGDLWSSVEKELASIIGSSVAVKDGAKEEKPGAAESYVSLNREAGIISVKTTAKNQAKVKQYLDKVKDYYSSQVLIEAKVVEVSLNDEFSSGIDWTLLTKKTQGLKGFDINTNFPAPTNSFATITIPKNGDITAAVDLAQIFGTTKTLSSPRILVMNNQNAILSFAKNLTYFSLSCDVTDAEINATTGAITKPAKIKLTSTPNTIPIGVILNLLASIDSKNNEVSLNVRPTLSRTTGIEFEDPAVSACVKSVSPTSTVTSKVPQVDVREMDSVLRLKSGEIMAIGGMIDQLNTNTDSGIPWISEVPIIGNAFKTVNKKNNSVQTVIFLKATIMPGYGVDETDKKLYNKFITDPHPAKF